MVDTTNEASHGTTEDTRIRDAHSLCSTLFQNTLKSIDPGSTSSSIELAQRLRIWGQYTGVWSREGLCLDDRLKDYEDVKLAILGLLKLILSNLEQGESVILTLLNGIDVWQSYLSRPNTAYSSPTLRKMTKLKRRPSTTDGKYMEENHGKRLTWLSICFWKWHRQ
jgi:hypothetical protein